MIFSVSNIVIQAAINHFGAACVAGNSAGLNFEYISYFFVNGFAQATVTFISQNYAAHQYQRCRRIARVAMVSAILFTTIVSSAFYRFVIHWLMISSQPIRQSSIMQLFGSPLSRC